MILFPPSLSRAAPFMTRAHTEQKSRQRLSHLLPPALCACYILLEYLICLSYLSSPCLPRCRFLVRMIACCACTKETSQPPCTDSEPWGIDACDLVYVILLYVERACDNMPCMDVCGHGPKLFRSGKSTASFVPAPVHIPHGPLKEHR